jgi:uncharacterized protein
VLTVANTQQQPNKMTLTVSEITELRIYPIKSCRGVKVSSIKSTLQGLYLDRRWMLVNEKNEFITIRQNSKMTLINTRIDEEKQQLVVTIGDDKEKQIAVPLFPNDEYLEQHTKPATVNIWGSDTKAYMYTDPKIQALFRDFIGDGKEVNLVTKDPRDPRICAGNGAPEVLGRQATVNFPDVLPVLIASEASLAELNGRLKAQGEEEITIERFRPNVIIKGGEAWSEDSWKTVRINGSTAPLSSWIPSAVSGLTGAVDMDVVARCARCQVPNVNPDTADKVSQVKSRPPGETSTDQMLE